MAHEQHVVAEARRRARRRRSGPPASFGSSLRLDRRSARRRAPRCRRRAPSGSSGRRRSSRPSAFSAAPAARDWRRPLSVSGRSASGDRLRPPRAATTRSRRSTIIDGHGSGNRSIAKHPSLESPELYTNRELSWLQFNERVLELAEDERTPLLERVKFCAIYASNLDEFFMVRVAGLHDQVDAGIDARGADGLSPERDARADRPSARASSATATRASGRSSCAPRSRSTASAWSTATTCDAEELRDDRPHVRRADLPGAHAARGRARAGPSPTSRTCRSRSRSGCATRSRAREIFARVKVPKEVLPRFVQIGDDAFVPLESVIARHLDELFPGMEILRHDYFRVTRDADFTVSDEADDLLRAVEDELRRRRFGEVVRLEVSSTMDPDMREYLIEQLAVDEVAGGRRRRGCSTSRTCGRSTTSTATASCATRPGQPVTQPAVHRRRARARRHVRRHARGRHPRAPPLRLVRGQRRALRAAGGGRPRRARDQDDRVPHLGRLGAGAVADRGGRARQAGGLPGGAEGALRRAPQHRLGARAGGGGRPRGARPARA